MDYSLQSQAIFNLLHLCDQDLPLMKNNNTNTHKDPTHNKPRCATSTIHHSYNSTMKIRTEGELSANFHELPALNSHNKENLKKILERLKDSPSPKKEEKTRYKASSHVKTANQEGKYHGKAIISEVQSRTLLPINPNIQPSLKQLLQRAKEKDLVKSLVKSKILQKLRGNQSKQSKHQNHKMSTLRGIQQLKRKGVGIQNQKTKGQNINYYNLLREERAVNINALINGKNSKIDIKHLLV